MAALQAVWAGLRETFFMFWETLWALILGFGLSGAVQAFASRGQMERVLGRPGPATLGKATFLGMVSSSCSYAATAMAKSLFQKGADFGAAMVFMIASTNLVIELGIVLALLIGWQFTASEFVGGIMMIALFGLVVRFLVPRRLVDTARTRLREGARMPAGHAADVMVHTRDPDEATERVPFRERVRSRAGWADAASYAIADITMLRREMLIGFTVAGFLAVLVPDALWSHVFVTGHGFWTSLENAIVGPFIAIFSFVCSIGNVPLAAALWKGGISFGGVIAFIFADLITLPLLLIYRKYYGTKLTLWILGFSGSSCRLGVLRSTMCSRPSMLCRPRGQRRSPPRGSPSTTRPSSTFCSWLSSLPSTTCTATATGSVGASDTRSTRCVACRSKPPGRPPALPMRVTPNYFCSDRCETRFLAEPGRHLKEGAFCAQDGVGRSHAVGIDPVCRMTVDLPLSAARRQHRGQDFWFCGTGCAARFDENPAAYAAKTAAQVRPS